MRKKVAALALGISLLALGATVANAQFGKLLKVLKDAAAELQTPDSVPTVSQDARTPTSSLSTLAGRWLPVIESCTANRGQSEQVIEIKGNSQIWSWGSCTYPQSIAGKSAYTGSGECSDEEGNTWNHEISIKISVSGNMITDVSSGKNHLQTAFKKCSNPLYLSNDDVPEPVKTTAVALSITPWKEKYPGGAGCNIVSNELGGLDFAPGGLFEGGGIVLDGISHRLPNRSIQSRAIVFSGKGIEVRFTPGKNQSLLETLDGGFSVGKVGGTLTVAFNGKTTFSSAVEECYGSD